VDNDAVVLELLGTLLLQTRTDLQLVRDVDALERGDERRDGLGGEKAAEVGRLLLTAGAAGEKSDSVRDSGGARAGGGRARMAGGRIMRAPGWLP
jgi:hypothetical protein